MVLSNGVLNTTTGSNGGHNTHLNSPIHPSFVPSIVSSIGTGGPISPLGSQINHNVNNWTASNVVLSQEEGLNTTGLNSSGLMGNPSKDKTAHKRGATGSAAGSIIGRETGSGYANEYLMSKHSRPTATNHHH